MRTVVMGVHNRGVQNPVDVQQTCARDVHRLQVEQTNQQMGSERMGEGSTAPVSLSSSYFTFDPRGISMTAFTMSGAVSPIARSCLRKYGRALTVWRVTLRRTFANIRTAEKRCIPGM